MSLKITDRERHLLLSALNIAQEDGSIYGGAETGEEKDRVDDELEAIREKLKA